MNWYSNLKIAKRLTISFVITSLIAAVIGLVGASAISSIAARQVDLYDCGLVPVSLLGEISTHFQRMRANLLEMVSAKDPAQRKVYADKVKERRESITKSQQALEKTFDSPAERRLFEEFKAQQQVFGPMVDKVVELSLADKTEEATALLFGDMGRSRESYQNAIEQFTKYFTDGGKVAAEMNRATGARAIWTQLVLTAVCILAAIGLGLFTTRSITHPLAQVVAALSNQGEGAAELATQAARKDEIGDVFRAATGVVDGIRGASRGVESLTVELASAAEQLSATTGQLAASNSQGSEQAQALSASAEEMSATVDSVARNAVGVGDAADEAHRAAVEGAAVVAETVQAMGEISEAVKRGALSVEDLGKRSDQIGVVVAVIEDIADQTNLLALNAAIEAARAGEHGRGFAVVADEVRKLAEKTVKATGEISATIRAIQAESKQAVESMEQTRETVGQGMNLADKAGAALQTIESKIGTAAEQATQIASATEELSVTIHSTAGNVEQIAQGVQQSSLAASEIAHTADSVAASATKLKRIMEDLSS